MIIIDSFLLYTTHKLEKTSLIHILKNISINVICMYANTKYSRVDKVV